ncbi:polar amino acid transport system substrate-binding protein [Marinobacter daqiaonensis]|uniref:Polar amino acid transport system substrate-binding protein n=1 Tax=Marinobacter daqiaonensis TaxID=650891 RepID=A0A1I6HMA6_9GAMM|nr:transporter substrate-binding domain-containing protein [Marinobacter daqiaonensis]SFR55528.1 polar amino acid transport system substrate-binding protein [Marinobacter daqiaonensis]
MPIIRALAALVLMVGLSPAHGEDAPIPETLVFNISTGGYPPFTIIHADGRISGIFWDVLAAITNRHDIGLQAIQLPPKRVDSLLHEGHADVTMRAIEWTDDPDAFLFTEPVMMTRDALFVHKDRAREIDSVHDLEGTLLTRLGFHYPWLQQKLREGSVDIIPLQEQRALFKRLYQGGDRFTGAVSNLHAGYWVLKNNPRWADSLEEAPIRFDEVAYRLMFPPRHAPMAALVNQELERMRISGELERIIQAYR